MTMSQGGTSSASIKNPNFRKLAQTMTDYGPARYERELERRRRLALRKRAKRISRKARRDNDDVVLDENLLLGELDRDRLDEGFRLLDDEDRSDDDEQLLPG